MMSIEARPQERRSWVQDFGWLPDGYVAQHRATYSAAQEGQAFLSAPCWRPAHRTYGTEVLVW